MLQVLAGLLAPARGQVRLDGRDLNDWPARQRAQRIAWMDQHNQVVSADTDPFEDKLIALWERFEADAIKNLSPKV